MTHSLSINNHTLVPMQSAWQTYHRQVHAAKPVDEVITVGVRLRQADVGILYQKHSRLTTTPLSNYEPGEMIDYHA